MKYIPLTEHLTTVAMLYEKCADLSSQIDELQQKILKSPEAQEQSRILQTTVNPPELKSLERKPEEENSPVIIEEQEQSKKSSVPESEVEEEKSNSVRKTRKLGKKIEKVRKDTSTLYCDHCGKTFETQRKFRKHQYGVEYRTKKPKPQQKEKSQEKEKEKKGSNKNEKFYVSI